MADIGVPQREIQVEPIVISLCAYHRSAGFCIDELREPTHWMPLPAPPDAGGTR